MPGYNLVWRWHFYAGLFCVPFVLWLSLTGSIYLFRPQIEAWLDRPYTHLTISGPRALAADQAAAAVRAVPGSMLHRYELPEHLTDAVQVIVGKMGVESRVYVHPQTLAILKVEVEDWRPMRVVFRLHGELMAGNWGSYLVELAASWAIVMLVTGLYLWWPRGQGAAGVIWPRLGRPGRGFWRDLHAVTGFWVSALALLFLLSGLPWAKSWGGYLKAIRTVAVGSAPKQDWPTGAATRAMQGDHAEHGGMTMRHPMGSLAPLDPIAVAVRPLHLAAPVLIAPPTGHGQPWTVKSDAANRPLRSDLTYDASGKLLTRKDFAQRRLVDRILGYGIAAHEGQLVPGINQLLNLFVAIGLTLVAVSGVVMWWRRRPRGVLGAPLALSSGRTGTAMIALLIAFGLALPLLGASMIALVVIERLAFRRIAPLRRWLGLRPLRTELTKAV